jgi:hypothetical protein
MSVVVAAGSVTPAAQKLATCRSTRMRWEVHVARNTSFNVVIIVSTWALGPTQPPIQRISSGVKQAEREADHSLSTIAAHNNACKFVSTIPARLHGVELRRRNKSAMRIGNGASLDKLTVAHIVRVVTPRFRLAGHVAWGRQKCITSLHGVTTQKTTI